MKLFCKVVFKREGGRAEENNERERQIEGERGFFSRVRVSERVRSYPSTIQIADYAPGFYVPSNWAASALGKDRPIARSALVNP